MKTGNGEYVFDFVIDVFEDKRAAVVFHFLEKAEEDAKASRLYFRFLNFHV